MLDNCVTSIVMYEMVPLVGYRTEFGNLLTAKWRTGKMQTNMQPAPVIGRDVTCVISDDGFGHVDC